MERVSNKVILSVQITGSDTQQSLLSFETSASFFEPAAALASLAEAFPQQFSGRVARQDSYSLLPEGFRLPHCAGVFGGNGDMLLGSVNYTPRDLEEDLRRTEGLPPGLIRSVQCLEIRRGVEATAVLVGDLAALVGLVGIWI